MPAAVSLASSTLAAPVVMSRPGHGRRPAAAPEQVHAERRIALTREPTADVADIVVKPGGLMDDYATGKWPVPVRENQVRGVGDSAVTASVSIVVACAP